MSTKVLGIDLGTGNSVVSIYEGKTCRVIENSEGNPTTPSVVNFSKDSDEITVGVVAKRKATTEPSNTIYEVKRLMGRQYTDPEVQRCLSKVPYTVTKSANGDVAIEVDKRLLSPPEISAHILRKMKKTAEDYLGESVEKAVVTVPAYFNNSQRQATIDAGKIAGLEVLRIINEPTAAALAFCQDKTFQKSTKLLVVDFGSGTLDVSILDALTVDSELTLEVISTSGDTHLGGADIDERLVDCILDEFRKQEGIDLRTDIIALSRVKETAERAKIELSSMMQTDINLPYLTATSTGPKHLSMKLTRSKFESLVEDLLEKPFTSIKTALSDAKMTIKDVHEVLLVGGSTRIPAFQERLKTFFGCEPNKSVNPDLAVAIGAAIQGSVLSGARKDVLLLDVIPLSLNIETQGDLAVKMVEKNTTIPYTKTETFTTASDNQPAVTIKIAQGEWRQFSKNREIGNFDLDGLPPAPRGIPKIEVSFSVDANSILTVTAKDLATGKTGHITITKTGGLSQAEIDAAQRDFEEHSKDDEEFAARVRVRNRCDSLIHSIDEMLKRENLEGTDRGDLEAIKNDAMKVLDNASNVSSSESENKIGPLYDRLGAISSKWYENQSASVSEPSTTDDVVDAEIVD